jgi:predicted nucleic acid-binding protein
MPREIVLDTDVLVPAFRSKRGASYELVRSIGRADWRLINVSVALALEYEGVLKRGGLLQDITELEIDDFLDYIFRTSNLIQFVLRQRPSLRDPDDERILEVAVQCGP